MNLSLLSLLFAILINIGISPSTLDVPEDMNSAPADSAPADMHSAHINSLALQWVYTHCHGCTTPYSAPTTWYIGGGVAAVGLVCGCYFFRNSITSLIRMCCVRAEKPLVVQLQGCAEVGVPKPPAEQVSSTYDPQMKDDQHIRRRR